MSNVLLERTLELKTFPMKSMPGAGTCFLVTNCETTAQLCSMLYIASRNYPDFKAALIAVVNSFSDPNMPEPAMIIDPSPTN